MKNKSLFKTGKILMVFLTGLWLFSSCIKGKYDLENISDDFVFNHNFSGPLVKGEMTIKKLVTPNDTVVFYGEMEDSIKLIIKADSAFNLNARDFVSLDDQELANYNIVAPFTVPEGLLPTTITAYDTIELYEFLFKNNERLDSMTMRTGYIDIDASSNFKHDGFIVITSPGVLIAGEPLQDTVLLSDAGGNYVGSKIIDISGDQIIFEDTVSNSNKIAVVFQLVLNKIPGNGIIAGEKATINFEFKDLEYESAYGYFGQNSFDLETDTIETEFEDLDFLKGTFTLMDPKVHIDYYSSVGVPLQGQIILSGRYNNGKVVDPATSIIDIYAPTYPNPDTSARLTIDKTVIPNLLDLLTFPLPSNIIFSGTANSNPEGDPGYQNFVTYDSRIEGTAEIEIPMHFKADLELVDTIELDLGDNEDVDFVEWAEIFFYVSNEFPLTVDVDFVIYDTITGTRLDSVRFDVLKAAPVNASGIVIKDQVDRVEKSIYLDQEFADNLFKSSTKIIITGKLKTTEEDGVSRDIKILTHYALNFQVSADAKIHYITNQEDN